MFYEKLTFLYLEMPKFNKTEDELVTMFDKWMFALRNLYRLLERPKALQDRIFQKLFDQAEIAKYSESERRQYEESRKDYWDYYSTVTTAEKKGRAEGLAEGMEKGRAEGRAEGEAKGRAEERLKNARNLKKNGVPVDVIAVSLGLTEEEIAQLS